MSRKSQIPRFFDIDALPIIRLRDSGRTYILLGMKDEGVKGHITCELIQYVYDPVRGDVYGLRAFTQSEPCGLREFKDEHGFTVIKYWLLRFDQVDPRWVRPEELQAIGEVLRDVVSYKQKGALKKLIGFAKDENALVHIERNFDIGEATSPSNPVIEADPKLSIVVSNKPERMQ